ncbi:hypothetical protein [Kitasatospora sp. NPDC093806]|uniref:hypothetical protein n=1 Tax=Kitasatospora sp. NPDC093806 TaxID=3155075 RepID=UPI003415CF54
MGYDVHITRRAHWWDEEGPDIAAAEWAAVVAADSDLARVPLPPGRLGDTEWAVEVGPARVGDALPEALWWRAGRIVAKHPSDALIATMCRVAKVLDARVQGDDGEYYDA